MRAQRYHLPTRAFGPERAVWRGIDAGPPRTLFEDAHDFAPLARKGDWGPQRRLYVFDASAIEEALAEVVEARPREDITIGRQPREVRNEVLAADQAVRGCAP